MGSDPSRNPIFETMSAARSGCLRIASHSPSLSAAGFWSTASGTPILPTSWSSAALDVDELRLRRPQASGQVHRHARDALSSGPPSLRPWHPAPPSALSGSRRSSLDLVRVRCTFANEDGLLDGRHALPRATAPRTALHRPRSAAATRRARNGDDARTYRAGPAARRPARVAPALHLRAKELPIGARRLRRHDRRVVATHRRRIHSSTARWCWTVSSARGGTLRAQHQVAAHLVVECNEAESRRRDHRRIAGHLRDDLVQVSDQRIASPRRRVGEACDAARSGSRTATQNVT